MSAPVARHAVILAALAAATAASPAALAGDGDIIVIHEVPPRVAYRAAEHGAVRARADAFPDEEVLGSVGVAAPRADSWRASWATGTSPGWLQACQSASGRTRRRARALTRWARGPEAACAAY